MPSFDDEINGDFNVTENPAYAHYVQVRHDRLLNELNLADAIKNWQQAGKPESWRGHLQWLNSKVTDMRNEENRLAETF